MAYNLEFEKYQAAGNDFIILDASKLQSWPNEIQIRQWCNRHFGIGADGCIILTQTDAVNLKMQYYNADGKPGSFCGNGARAACRFAQLHNWIDHYAELHAADGIHRAQINSESDSISIAMNPVQQVTETDLGYELNTGSPHLIIFVDDVHKLDVEHQGRSIRNSPRYRVEGINVNFISITDEVVFVRTYERGVEAETLSCGTGVTAAALALMHKQKTRALQQHIQVNTKGGILYVNAHNTAVGFTSVQLTGPAHIVFSGKIQF